MKILLLIFLLTALFKKRSNVLYCGIFAWTGDSHKKFNWDKFNILGIYNDTRGGDSCGRVSGNVAQYGIGKQSDYRDFMWDVDNFHIQERMIIGHDRKATTGYAVTLANAQPVVIGDGEPSFVMAHNGTILNIDDLVKKYAVTVPFGKSDSYALAEIINDYGFDVLSEYRGAAALIIYDRAAYLKTGDTILYVFKGASKMYSTSDKLSEERPLYKYEKNGSIYFSSMLESLAAIGGNKDNIEDLDCNYVYCYKNGKFFEENSKHIDRSKAGQYKDYVAPVQRIIGYNKYSEYGDEYYDSYVIPSKVDITCEYLSTVDTKITFTRGLFYKSFEVANGMYYLEKDGTISRQFESKASEFYFINGVLVENKEVYDKTLRWITAIENLKPTTDLYKKSILPDSKFPLYFSTGSPDGDRFYHMVGEERILYNGTLKPYFSDYEYVISKGICTSKKWLPSTERNYPLVSSIKALDIFKPSKKKDLDMIEQEAARIMSEVLESIATARDHLKVLEDTDMTKTLVKNLDRIEDDLFLNTEGNLYKKTLILNVEWKDQF